MRKYIGIANINADCSSDGAQFFVTHDEFQSTYVGDLLCVRPPSKVLDS